MVRPSSMANTASGSRSKCGVQFTGTGVDEIGLMPSALIAASPSAIWSANSMRHERCASCWRSGRSASALSALLRLTRSLPHCTPAMLEVERIFNPGTESRSAVPASSCSMTISPDVAR